MDLDNVVVLQGEGVQLPVHGAPPPVALLLLQVLLHDLHGDLMTRRAGHLRYFLDLKKIKSTYFFKTITL